MNSLIENEFPLSETQGLRYDLLNMISDSDLAYKLPGDNPTLGELCREIGDTQHSYIESFKSLKMDWLSHHEAGQANTVERLRAWYESLDEEFERVLRGFSEEDLHSKQIDRGQDFSPSAHVQFQIYHEAMLIAYAKASVYLKALQKELNNKWKMWVG
jgi:uncharacterized damage-inducible protein DinB